MKKYIVIIPLFLSQTLWADDDCSKDVVKLTAPFHHAYLITGRGIALAYANLKK